MQATGHTGVRSCLNNKNVGKKKFDLQIFVVGEIFFQFPMKHFEIAEFHAANYHCYVILLLLIEPYQHQGAGWMPYGSEGGLHTAWPCSGGKAGEGNGSLS